jgi:tRNA1Val (adenine37-N6)-methyltransferase
VSVEAALDVELERALKKRPPGWSAPGPKPRGWGERSDLRPGPDEDLSFLTGDFRIFQRKDGHRWSLDDFATALVAIEEARAHGRVLRALDMGCGIGSVLLMVAWALPEARLVGVEAQDLSAGLARRSIAFDGVDDRVEVRSGDLRDDAIVPEGAVFDLVTGTPPYIPLGHGIVSDKVQRGPCCFETRGGIEDYVSAAARRLAPGGVFVACAGAKPEGRTLAAAEAAGLVVRRHVDFVPREGKATLFTVTAMGRADDDHPPARFERFVVRDAACAITAEMHRARETMGLPPLRVPPVGPTPQGRATAT